MCSVRLVASAVAPSDRVSTTRPRVAMRELELEVRPRVVVEPGARDRPPAEALRQAQLEDHGRVWRRRRDSGVDGDPAALAHRFRGELAVEHESSPGTWCKSSLLMSSVMWVAA
jgi:hypothetical protein